MSPSDRPDAALMSDAQLLEEIQRRHQARAAGVCDFCARRAADVPACGEPARHRAAAARRVAMDLTGNLRGDSALLADGAPPAQPLVSCVDLQQAELVRDMAREMGRQHRNNPDGPTLAHLMTEIGEVSTALLERGAPQRGELVMVAAVALGWAEHAARRAEADREQLQANLEARQRTDHAIGQLNANPAGPSGFLAMAASVRSSAQAAEHRRGGLQYPKVAAAALLALGEAGEAPLSPLAADALAALRVGLRNRKGGVALSYQRAVALADYLAACGEPRGVAAGAGVPT